MTKRVAKSEAHYQTFARQNEHCSLCSMFQAPDSCSAVTGLISPHGWCRYFEVKVRNVLTHKEIASSK